MGGRSLVLATAYAITSSYIVNFTYYVSIMSVFLSQCVGTISYRIQIQLPFIRLNKFI